MHIAFFANTYLPVISGVVRSMTSFREALSKMGHNVFVFAQNATDYEDEEPFVFRYPAVDLPAQPYPLAIPVSNFINRLLPSLKLDVIHSHHPILVGQAAARKAEELHVPLVFTHHTHYKEYSHYIALPQEFVKDVIERWIGDYISHCHHVIVPSESVRRMLAETYGVVKQVSVIPTGIEVALYAEADGTRVRREQGWGDDVVLVSVGRLAAEKNWETLLKAMPEVMAGRNNVRLVILGDGPDRKALQKMARELGLGNQIAFAGAIPFTEVPAYLKAADLFCFASTSETQGLVTMEALAAGLPVVAVRATGTSDVATDGVDSLLVENDPAALAAAIGRVVEDGALRARLRAGAQGTIQEFAIERQAEKLLAAYEKAREAQRAGRTVQLDKQKPIFDLDLRKLLGVGERD